MKIFDVLKRIESREPSKTDLVWILERLDLIEAHLKMKPPKKRDKDGNYVN